MLGCVRWSWGDHRRFVLVTGVLFTMALSDVGAQPANESAVQKLIDEGDYDRAEALARAQWDLVRQRTADSAEFALASDQLVDALLWNGKGALPGTLALAEQAQELSERLDSSSPPRVPRSTLNLARALIAATEYERAAGILRQAVSRLPGSADADSLVLTTALDQWGIALIQSDRPLEALPILQRALDAKRRLSGLAPTEIATTLLTIGWAEQRLGNYAAAGAPIREATALRAKQLSSHPAHAEALSLLGLQLWFEGRPEAARDISAQALGLSERTLRPDHPQIALALKRLGLTVLDLGDLSSSLDILRRALRVAERTFGGTHFETWAYVNDLAEAERRQGDYVEARKLFERSLEIAEARFGPLHDSVATAVHNLALVDAGLGDYARARREQVRAAAIWERVLGANHPFVAVALTELGATYSADGALTDALPLLQRALSIRERNFGASHPEIAKTLADIGTLHLQQGRIKEAEQDATRALTAWQESAGTQTPDLARIYRLLAEVHAARGHLSLARDYLDRALGILGSTFGPSHADYADVQVVLARVLEGLGEDRPAVAAAAEAEATSLGQLRLLMRSLPERQSLNYARRRPRGLDVLLSLADTSTPASITALDRVIRGRAVIMDEMASRQRAGSLDAIAPLRAELASARQRLANLIVRGPGARPPSDYARLVERTRSEVETLETKMAERSLPFRVELARARVGVSEVRAALGSAAALVSIVRYTPTRAVRSGGPAQPQPAYLAFVLRADTRDPILVRLGSAGSIDDLIGRWRKAVVAEVADDQTNGSTGSSRGLGVLLRRRIWDPLEGHIGDAKLVFVVPDGALNLVPLAALPSKSGRHLLEDAPLIHYLTAERDLVRDDPAAWRPGVGILAIGGPTFGDGSSFAALNRRGDPLARGSTTELGPAPLRGSTAQCQSFRSLRFDALPATRAEAQAVAGMWREFGRSDARGADAQTLLGAAATERSFKQLGPGHRVLHIATHGFFLDQECSFVAPGARSVGGIVAARPASPAALNNVSRRVTSPENPLLLSGLALAGANRRAAAAADEDDGILTAEEVASLNLEGVEWAVLSACDTGLGTLAAGEGVLGLRRAFHVAGARTVIMSLWSVDDRATREWMEALYRARLRQHLDTADAMREASLQVIRARRARGQSTHPFHWAAFVAAGDWY